MKRIVRRPPLAGAALLLAASGFAGAVMAGSAAPHNVLEAARKTVEDFDGSPHRTEFRATIRRADAVVIMPPSRSVGNASDGADRRAVVTVHDGARGAWSNPAFYRVRFSDNAPSAQDAGILFTVMNKDAVRRLMDGAITLGGDEGARVMSVTTGVAPDVQVGATADILAFVDVDKRSIGPSSFDGWRLSSDEALNGSFYAGPATPKTILSRGAVRTPGVEKLIGGLRIAKGVDTSPP